MNYSLLGNYDPYRNLRTFIYTGVRNAMTNYMYHQNKESHTDIDTIDDSMWQTYKGVGRDAFYENKVYFCDDEPDYTISSKEIVQVCDKYKMFGNYQRNIEIYFNEIGIETKESDLKIKENENTLVSDAIKCEILWNIFDKR